MNTLIDLVKAGEHRPGCWYGTNFPTYGPYIQYPDDWKRLWTNVLPTVGECLQGRDENGRGWITTPVVFITRNMMWAVHSMAEQNFVCVTHNHVYLVNCDPSNNS